MEPKNDAALLELINSPKTREKGFRILVETYQRNVYGIVRKMVIIHDDANDVVQNTFIKAFKNIHNFNQKSTIITWIYSIAEDEILIINEKKNIKITTPIKD